MSTIGNRIRTRREALGLSQDELAKRLGYKSRSSINKIELDQRNLTQSKIKSISDVLDTTPAYIMGWVDAENPEKPAAESGSGLLEQELISLLSQLSPADFARVKALAALTPQELQKLLDYAELLLAARKA